MGLPKQLRAQIKKGQDIEDQLRKEQEEGGTEDKSQEEIDVLLAEVTAPEEQKPTADVTELHPKPEGGDPEVTPEPKPERTDWKQKYAVLQGKYDAEVPRLSESLREASTRINGLEDRLAGMAPAPAPEPKAKPRTDFSAEEVADYGEDLLEVIGRKARAIVESEYLPQMNSLTTELGSLKLQLGETGQKVAKQETNDVFTQLDNTVKDWRKVNVDPAFHEWLDQVDPFSGATRKNLMLSAFDRKNAHQVKAFFDKYAEENATVLQNPAGAPSGQGGQTTPTLDLQNYIAPGQPRSGGDVSAPTDKRVWTNSEIGSFYSDVQKGRYKTRPDDKSRIEADIVAATREGRIR
jgi:hypothetical protein